MTEKKKLSLREIEIRSFVTTLTRGHGNTIAGNNVDITLPTDTEESFCDCPLYSDGCLTPLCPVGSEHPCLVRQ